MMKPKLFIGSATESLGVAYAIQDMLSGDAEVTVWDQGIFNLSRSILSLLIENLERSDFGVFVLSPDDLTNIRGETVRTARDNVIFELGLFFGKLGADRTFFLIPDGVDDLRLPTDLLGITSAKYDPNREDQNFNAAVAPACNKIRQYLKAYLKSSEETTLLISKVKAESLSGRWYATHYSRDEDGSIAISRHKYELRFYEFGKVTGEMIDKLSAAEWKFKVEGEYTNEGVLALFLRTDQLGLLGSQFHYKLDPDATNIGLIASYDRQKKPFSTLIVFSKQEPHVHESELEQALTYADRHLIFNPIHERRIK